MPFNEDRIILNLTDSELEDLIKKWLARLDEKYVGFERPTQSADMGRDAVGFLSKQRYDGDWHNYQCKHLKAPLGKAGFVTELGKIFHYALKGEFTLPTKYIFVCPNSAVREVKKLIDRPSLIGPFLEENWDEYCLTGISTTPCPLTPEIQAAIQTYPFANIELWKASELVEKPLMRAVLHQHVDIDPGEAPRVPLSDVPDEVGEDELAYVLQLITVFGADCGTAFTSYTDVAKHAVYGEQIINARRRYLERQAFRRHFRDNLPAHEVDNVDADVLDRVIDRYHVLGKGPPFERLMEVMSAAATAQVSGPLGRHNRVTSGVKQGACHHFANVGRMPWA